MVELVLNGKGTASRRAGDSNGTTPLQMTLYFIRKGQAVDLGENTEVARLLENVESWQTMQPFLHLSGPVFRVTGTIKAPHHSLIRDGLDYWHLSYPLAAALVSISAARSWLLLC